MADYFTLPVIAKRLGYMTHNTIYALIINKGFPAYKRYKPAKWYTNDDLIRTWQLTQAKLARETLIKRRLRLKGAKQTQQNGTNTTPQPIVKENGKD